jgi:hypothetical protein
VGLKGLDAKANWRMVNRQNHINFDFYNHSVPANSYWQNLLIIWVNKIFTNTQANEHCSEPEYIPRFQITYRKFELKILHSFSPFMFKAVMIYRNKILWPLAQATNFKNPSMFIMTLPKPWESQISESSNKEKILCPKMKHLSVL